jgi:biotin carboxyl carrier protein
MSLSARSRVRNAMLAVAALGAVALWAWPVRRATVPEPDGQSPDGGKASVRSREVRSPPQREAGSSGAGSSGAGTNGATSPDKVQDVIQGPRLELWVRAPVAGVLTSDADWPRVGDTVDDGAELGAITPRPAGARREQAGTSGSVSEARAAVKAQTAALADAIISHRRLAALRREANATSDAAVDEAGEAVERARSRLAAARTELARLSDQPPSVDAPQAPTAIVADRGGTVVEVAAHPGETVGAGAPLLRLDANGR